MPFDFEPFDAILLDLDGTLYHEEHALPGAAALVDRFRREDRPYACLTNSTLSPSQLRSRLGRMGVQIEQDRIFTAASAAADFVLSLRPRPGVFNLATEGMRELLDGRVDWVETDAISCDAVIVGAPECVYATPQRQRIAMTLARKGARLVGICADRVYPSPRGLELGVGALTAMLAYAANATPVFTGKPERFFFEELCRHIGVRPERCVLIGDNPESDIAGARNVGMKTILVLTGVTQKADLARIDPALKPDWVVEDLTKL